jgi:predicted ribosome quality control (RQC) complex YloA/Tae2 family protein
MNAFLIERLANDLKKVLDGCTLIDVFSTSINDIYLVFEPIVLKVSFYQGQAYFQIPDPEKLQKKNRLAVYKTLKGKKVSSVQCFPYDRIFKIKFKKGETLTFHLFGRFGQVTHYRDGEWLESFPAKITKIEDEPEYSFEIGNKTVQDLKFLSYSEAESLQNIGFNDAGIEHKALMLRELKSQVLNQKLFLNKGEKKYTLDYVREEQNIAEFDNVLDALDQHARLYISHQVYNQTKSSHKGKLIKDLSNLNKKLKSAERGLAELNRASSYKEKADLLMANMWQIEKRAKQVTLTSFDGENEVIIKLQETLTPQANAERYYKKGKNESKQRNYAQKHLNEMSQKVVVKEIEIAAFDELESLKEIRKVSEMKESQHQLRVPYRSTAVDGFEIRIGKGAKDNDELLRSHTTKFDLWLHAKDVSGSHVIIRNPGRKEIPISTIEKVACIAAFYSKSKSELLAAVIYTDRKYIRKPKGATPGLVKVDKEKMILVEPKQSVN